MRLPPVSVFVRSPGPRLAYAFDGGLTGLLDFIVVVGCLDVECLTELSVDGLLAR
jgi:hypothetical protein